MDSETDFDNRASTDETFLSEAEDFDDVFASALGMISDLRVDSQSLKAEQWNYICRESGWENLKQEDINEVDLDGVPVGPSANGLQKYLQKYHKWCLERSKMSSGVDELNHDRPTTLTAESCSPDEEDVDNDGLSCKVYSTADLSNGATDGFIIESSPGNSEQANNRRMEIGDLEVSSTESFDNLENTMFDDEDSSFPCEHLPQKQPLCGPKSFKKSLLSHMENTTSTVKVFCASTQDPRLQSGLPLESIGQNKLVDETNIHALDLELKLDTYKDRIYRIEKESKASKALIQKEFFNREYAIASMSQQLKRLRAERDRQKNDILQLQKEHRNHLRTHDLEKQALEERNEGLALRVNSLKRQYEKSKEDQKIMKENMKKKKTAIEHGLRGLFFDRPY